MDEGLLQNRQDSNSYSYGSSATSLTYEFTTNSKYPKDSPNVHYEELEDGSVIDDDHRHDGFYQSLDAAITRLYHFILQFVQGATWPNPSAVIIALLPSPITAGYTGKPLLHKRLYSTSYLDGIRGVACFIVFCCHSRLQWSPSVDDMNTAIEAMPFLGIIFQGNSAVSIFFVVSGFSISYSPLRKARSNQRSAFGETMSSFLFRRHMRLYLPIVATTFWWAILAYMGWTTDSTDQGGSLPHFPAFWEQLCDWGYEMIRFSDPLRPIDYQDPWHFGTVYNGVTWTIPFEFRGSIIVFVVVSALANVSGCGRATFVGMLSFACLYTGYWDVCLFLAGVVLCDVHLMREEKLQRLQSDQFSHEESNIAPFPSRGGAKLTARLLTYLLLLFFALGWLFMSIPSPLTESWYDTQAAGPYFAPIITLTPPLYIPAPLCFRFWPAVGSILFMIGLDAVKPLQRLFTNGVAQYLGKISYSLYLLHTFFLAVPGLLMSGVLIPVWGTYWGSLVAFICTAVMVIWASDVFARCVDEEVVRFARWVYGKCVKHE